MCTCPCPPLPPATDTPRHRCLHTPWARHCYPQGRTHICYWSRGGSCTAWARGNKPLGLGGGDIEGLCTPVTRSMYRTEAQVQHTSLLSFLVAVSSPRTHRWGILRPHWWNSGSGWWIACLYGSRCPPNWQNEQSDNHCQTISVSFDDDCHYYTSRQTATQQNKN